MKRKFLFLSFLMPLLGIAQTDCSNGRYYNDIFPNVTVSTDITYGSNYNSDNINVSLEFDIYQPQGDTAQNRPLIILAHGGSFVSGAKNSPEIVDLCTRFAKKGYVTVSMEYRLETILNVALAQDKEKVFMEAVYRAVCDQRALVRFFRKSVTEGNPYKINPNQIIVGGNSAGAILALHTAYLDQASKIPNNLNTVTLGDWNTTTGTPGYSSDVAAVVNLCGALKDSVWLEQGDQPFVSMHGDQDGVVPYATDTANPGIPITVVSGSYSLHQRALNVGVENPFYTFVGEDHTPYVTDAALMDTVEFFVRDFLYDQLCNQALGTIPVIKENDWIVFPNPASTELQVKLEGNKKAEWSIYDLNGKIISKGNFTGNSHTISVNDLPSGMYIIQIKSPDFEGKKRFVKS